MKTILQLLIDEKTREPLTYDRGHAVKITPKDHCDSRSLLVYGRNNEQFAAELVHRFNSNAELLAACKDLLALCHGGTGNALQRMERAELAIRKATQP